MSTSKPAARQRGIGATPDLQKSEGISKYVQLSSLLRASIVKGRWAIGDKLPTVAELAEEHGVALVTVRQALHMLVEEGLVTSQSGRGTFVSAVPEPPSASLRSAINNPNAVLKSSQIRVLSRERRVKLPAELCTDGQAADRYVLIRKIHLHDQVPFCVMDLYVAEDVFDRFPPRSEQSRKINGLLLETMPQELGDFHTVITIVPADYELGNQLRYSFAAPVARIRRSVTDKKGRIVYAGIFCYRGDRFVLDMVVPAETMLRQPTLGAPTTHS